MHMEATIKETVKNIFKTHAFEEAVALTESCRGEYIREFGVKSWNALVTYYKHANIIPEPSVVAEPEAWYPAVDAEVPDTNATDVEDKASSPALSKKEIKKFFHQKADEVYASLKDETGGVPFEELMEALIKLQDEFYVTYGVKLGDYYKKSLEYYRGFDPSKDEEKFLEQFRESESTDSNALVVSDDANDNKKSENEVVETVEYMLYQNAGDKIDWYGHFVNYKGLKVGDEGMMIRMNNLGVGMGRVIATAQMTMEEIGMFHKCYAVIRANTASDNRRVMLFKRAFNNLKGSMKDPAFATKTKSKDICDFVLNYDSNK